MKINIIAPNLSHIPVSHWNNRLKSLNIDLDVIYGYPENKIHYIVGDVLESLKDNKNIPEKIAILRLDTDWYESSKFELEKLYDSVVVGGLIIFDDYYHWDGQRKATDDFFKSRNINYEFVNTNNGKTSVIIKK